ncbi:DUF4350 domain-containing protein [Flavobacterium orientale]|uniref:DUF4350 domain-containing protein n=1 Tax=Flavobacterium orientale TaxID=1756020 RepID=A0A916Y175_9FLAO|nr:DUF4350 domain-containing protein [Flavobacterium orientale]GGD26172.1 hypothetical protein GCM10011343_15430 [Flavobacterium orientale]
MNCTLKIYIFLLLLIIAGIILMDANRPKPIDWRPTYKVSAKTPLGLYVLDNEIETLFSKDKIERFKNTPYEFFDGHYDYDTLVNTYDINGTFLSITEENTIDEESILELLYFVGHGNQAFLSMKYFSEGLADSLQFKIENQYYYKDTLQNYLTHQKFSASKYNMSGGVSGFYFGEMDSLKTTILGYHKIGDKSYPNFIKVDYKKGSFLLHTQPAAFSNFHLLKDNHSEYAQKLLSYIPNQPVYWYQKNLTADNISQSPLRFVFANPALKWAWYFFLFGMILFILFNAKRKQRIVPIIKPLENTTVDFTKTIGNLYFQEGNHGNLIDKKIIFFLEKIRTDYMIDTSKLDDAFVKKLHLKSGKDLLVIDKAVRLIHKHHRRYQSTEEDLIEINTILEKII